MHVLDERDGVVVLQLDEGPDRVGGAAVAVGGGGRLQLGLEQAGRPLVQALPQGQDGRQLLLPLLLLELGRPRQGAGQRPGEKEEEEEKPEVKYDVYLVLYGTRDIF